MGRKSWRGYTSCGAMRSPCFEGKTINQGCSLADRMKSIRGHSRTLDDTKKLAKMYETLRDESARDYRIGYAVHEIRESPKDGDDTGSSPQEKSSPLSKFIGIVDLHSLTSMDLKLPDELALPEVTSSTTVTLNLAYTFLPEAWGKGFGTEAVALVFDACTRASSFFHPYPKVFVRSIVNMDNLGSQRVMAKTGMKDHGVYHWTGEPVFIAGQWRTEDNLKIYGKYLVE